jgi:hypothetical protein
MVSAAVRMFSLVDYDFLFSVDFICLSHIRNAQIVVASTAKACPVKFKAA